MVVVVEAGGTVSKALHAFRVLFGESEHGYRFIWCRDDGSLQPARGQARIPSVAKIERLATAAQQAGWGNLRGEGA